MKEKFSVEEKKFLKPFFSNVDRGVFVVQHLPEEVIGALSSRYSRSVHSLRRLFINEYVNPIIYPEKQKNWEDFNRKQRLGAKKVRIKFIQLVEYLNKSGGVDQVVNIQRARKFFDTWLAQFGDDSIAEMGGVHLFLEGISNIAAEEIINKRIGISPLAKSSRYVSYSDKMTNGKFRYVIPPELKGKTLEKLFVQTMDGLFSTYTDLAEKYLEYIVKEFPKGEDETDISFINTRKAKRFDDLRDLLPFATMTNVALFGNGRAFEDLINRMMAHPLRELQNLGDEICSELEKVVPSFVKRPRSERGTDLQEYRGTLLSLKRLQAKKFIKKGASEKWPVNGVKLLDYSTDAIDRVVSAWLFEGTDLNLSKLKSEVKKMTKRTKKEILERIFDARMRGNIAAPRYEVRFRKVPRAFENAWFTFECLARGGDFRDLHRHRQNTEGHQLFSTRWGFELETEVENSPFAKLIKKRLAEAEKLADRLENISPYLMGYAVPFAFFQHWYWNISAREIYWMVELRTGPQGRTHYRKICQEIARQVQEVCPELFAGLMVDWQEYKLSRRESEKYLERRLAEIKNNV